jgi:hypothetical protein
MQRVLFKLLRILRFVRDYIIGRAAGRWSLYTAFLGRRISELRHSWNRKPGTSRNPRTAGPLLPENRASSYSTSGGSAVLREYVVAASALPGRLAASSASLASFQEDSGRSASVPPSPTSSTSIHQPHPPSGRHGTASSSGNLSGWSATTPYVHSHPHDTDEGRSPVVPPSSPSSLHGPLRPLTNRNMWSGSSTSINLSIQGPSTASGSLPTLTEESTAMDPAQSTPSYSAMDQPEMASQHSTITSSATSEFILPEGRFLQLIHSDQIPRYFGNVTM